ncbi:hypothetical protein LTS15_001477 [Exophiala xenobiotica]|nr:hypothetical protein LTS15_001477 [Exophiala xenobiotica]
MASDEPEKGDKVSWNWGGGAPGGTVAEKKTEGEVSITTKKGNKVKKNAEPDNPAVRIERSGNDVVKKASELNVEEKANGSGDKRKHDDEAEENGDKKDDESEKKDDGLKENAEGKTVRAGGKTDKAKPAAKKQKTDEPAATEKKNPGRPKKAEGAPAKSKRAPTPRSTEGIGSRTRSQR